ncbi:MAG: hypothetical protein M3Z05_17080 [Gemmatimonadota bacterium]|nr:hypothetical protein [Gemmatimonadota bacterium]
MTKEANHDSKRPSKMVKGTTIAGVQSALRRAGERARELAARTQTPLVIYCDGKIEMRMVTNPAKPK